MCRAAGIAHGAARWRPGGAPCRLRWAPGPHERAQPDGCMFGGQAMSASRFEAVCGKGDAKKWKSSLWAASPEGIPEQVQLVEEGLPSALTHCLRAESPNCQGSEHLPTF